MKHLDLLNEFRELIGQLRSEVESASAMQQYDTHKVSENVICGVLREICNFPGIRSLNAEQSDFPAIDLADDDARVAIQVTASSDIDKVKHTITTFLNNELDSQYDRLIVYVLTTKQNSYSQKALGKVLANKFAFSANEDIWDYRDVCAQAAEVTPAALQKAVTHLKSYLRGVPEGLADEDIDPPLHPSENLVANMLAVYFPQDLHVAQLNQEIIQKHKKGRSSYLRDTIRDFCNSNDLVLPSGYIAHAGTLVTFMDLEQADSPFRNVIEQGTQEVLSPSDFWQIDEDHERVFKSLLRFCLQQRLFEERVQWYQGEKQFVFMPRKIEEDVREEVWQGDKIAHRQVFSRQYNKKDRSKVFTQKHLSFAVEFLRLDADWMIAITPSWFFSMGTDFRKSGFSHDNLSWLKRQEKNQQVLNHFRFIAAWLKSIDEDDLFSESNSKSKFLSFGDPLGFGGSPSLEESLWEPLPKSAEDDDIPQTGRLFG